MLKRRFEWKDGTELGAGWVPAWNEHLNFPTVGYGAAHDVLEHFPKLGGMQGEMMAFGAMYFVRSEYHWRGGDIYSVQVHDIANELHKIVLDDKQIESPGRSRLQSDYVDADSLRNTVRKAVISTLYELECGADYSKAHYRRQMPSDICQRIEGWIMKGAVAAERRYTRMGVPQGWQMTELFNEIEEQFDRSAQCGEEGEYIDVRVNFAERAVTVVRERPLLISNH